jgi:hypothetical protein
MLADEVSAVYEVSIAIAVLVIGVLIGSFLKPNEAQTRPLSPDEIAGHPAESAHHSH